jgi:hypothetical protein
MWKFIHEHIKEFWKGFFGGGVVWGGILFSTPNFLVSYPVAFILKLLGAGALALVSGLATAYATDLYKHKIKPKLFKNVRDKDDKEKAA